MGDNVILVGFMGAGKSSVGRLLARRMGRCFVETDDMITAREGRSIPEIFAGPRRGPLPRASRRRRSGCLALKSRRRHRHRRRPALPRRSPGRAARARHGGMALRRLRRALRAGPPHGPPADARGARPATRSVAIYRAREPYYRQADLTVDTTGTGPPTRWSPTSSARCVRSCPPPAEGRPGRPCPRRSSTRLAERPLLCDGAMGTMLYAPRRAARRVLRRAEPERAEDRAVHPRRVHPGRRRT